MFIRSIVFKDTFRHQIPAKTILKENKTGSEICCTDKKCPDKLEPEEKEITMTREIVKLKEKIRRMEFELGEFWEAKKRNEND